jgi:hypothetical protein
MVFFRHLLLAFISLIFVLPHFADAAQASLSLSPKDGTYTLGNTFSVGVILDTGGVSVNAVEGKIRYPIEDLAIIGVSTEGSPITSWTTSPDTTSEKGLVSFGGINPEGMIEKGKQLFSITFRVVRSGETRIRIASGAAILSEGGAGTNILTDLRGGTYTLSNNDVRTEALRNGPSILRSSSHPDEAAWYGSPDVLFEWARTPETDSIRFSVDQNSEGAPTTVLDGSLESKAVSLASGVWYGHLAVHDRSGWGPVGHLRVQIDTEKPDTLTVIERPRVSQDEPKIELSIEAKDARSGISHYEIALDGGEKTRWEDDGNHLYSLGIVPPGKHIAEVRAFDRAGNSIVETVVVEVQGLSLPTIEPTPSSLFVGGDIDFEGAVGDGQTVRVAIGFDGGESKTEDIASGPGGRFIHTFVFPQVGTYRIKAQAVDKRGATSEWTPEVLIRVEAQSFLGAVGAVGGSGIIPSLLFLITGLFVGMWYGGRKMAFAPVSGSAFPYQMISKTLIPLRFVREIGVIGWQKGKKLFSRSPSEKTQIIDSHTPPPRPASVRPRIDTPPPTTVALKQRAVPQPHQPTILGRER